MQPDPECGLATRKEGCNETKPCATAAKRSTIGSRLRDIRIDCSGATSAGPLQQTLVLHSETLVRNAAGARELARVNVNTTDATTGVTALLLPAQNTLC